ncbi:Phospholipase DDHD1 [Cyberlindnera fabianii]|nr:Phospholipase DDHD1 [Cyberlindnera fabianii]
MPDYYNYTKTEEPKKFTPFSIYDSQRLEREHQNRLDGASFENKISVNEDFLFEVDLEERVMSPVYWDGAVYEVRRGSWFTSDGVPVKEELAEDLEQGYIAVKPYDKTSKDLQTNPSGNPLLKRLKSNPIDDVYVIRGEQKVVYGDDKTAYLLSKGYGGKFQVSFLKAVKNLPAIGATLLVRGFEHPELEKSKESGSSDISYTFSNLSEMFALELDEMFREKSGSLSEKQQENNTKEAMKLEIEQDYQEENQAVKGGGRQVDHLILCIHGIGQMLGTKFQAVNFNHTVNVMRKNLKKVYSENKEFQKLLNDKTGDNCRIQVLPLTWRHKVDFSTDTRAASNLPSLADVTVDEFRPLRNLVGSVLFDVLLYYEPHYMNQILSEVVLEANRQYDLFKQRNPDFGGKVSLVGHSLGSAIAADLLSMQPDEVDPESKDPLHFHFKVENYFGMGSPVGVFNVLKRTNIAPRSIAGPSREGLKTFACENYYNIFHPCDPIGYRVEPLIRREFADFEPASVPFLVENFNKQLSHLADVRDSLTQKMVDYVSDAANITSLIQAAQKQSEEEMTEKEQKQEEVAKTVMLDEEQLKIMSAMNYNGRVDYNLPQGYLELSIVSGVTAHTSYFEDENIAAFLLKETLTHHDPVSEKKVSKRVSI